jgi:hypothetical protein
MGQHGGRQPDLLHHGGNQSGEDRPHEQQPVERKRSDIEAPEGQLRKKRNPTRGPDPGKPGGRYWIDTE